MGGLAARRLGGPARFFGVWRVEAALDARAGGTWEQVVGVGVKVYGKHALRLPPPCCPRLRPARSGSPWRHRADHKTCAPVGKLFSPIRPRSGHRRDAGVVSWNVAPPGFTEPVRTPRERRAIDRRLRGVDQSGADRDQGLAIAATALDSNPTAPRIVAITTTTAPATPTARTSFSIAFPS